MPFVDAPSTFTRRNLWITIDGDEKTGKTHLSLTAPGPKSILDLNDGLDGVVQKAVVRTPGQAIKVAHWPLPDGRTKADVKNAAVKVWTGMSDDYRTALTKSRTVIVDSGTEVYRLARQSEFGDVKSTGGKGQLDYDMVNSKMRGLLRLFHAHKANVILTHQLKDEWQTYVKPDGSKASRTTGKRIRDGFDEIGFMIQVGLRTFKRIDNDGLHFGCTLEICRFDPKLEGTEFLDDLCNLPFIMGTITDTDTAEWEK